MIRKSALFVVIIVMILVILAGCKSMERLTRNEALGTDGNTSPWNIERTLTVDGYVGKCEYSVDSYTIYDSWEDAGISEDEIFQNNRLLQEEGVLLVTITMCCKNRNDMFLNLETMGVNDLELFIPSMFDDTESAMEMMERWATTDNICANPSYLDKPGNSELGYFYVPILEAGETMTFTLGYSLSKELLTAAEDGSLCIFYTTNGIPQYKEDMLLLSLG